MKYIIKRQSKFNPNLVEVKRTKCTESWCSEGYMKKYPDRVWQFSKQGAQKIVDRCTRFQGWNFVYWMEEVAAS